MADTSTKEQSNLNRRTVMSRLLTSAGGIALAGCKDMAPGKEVSAPLISKEPQLSSNAPLQKTLSTSQGPFPLDGKQADDYDIHSRSPLAAETKRERMPQGPITAVEHFFVRNNLKRPSDEIVADRDTWTLTVEGVAHPMSLSLGELKTLGIDTSVAVVQCSGNGRAFFDHGASGSQWRTGAAGCAVWSGLSVATLMKHLGGAHDDMQFLTATGGDPLPKGVPRESVIVERSIPLDKGLNDCLLAWEMNGEPLPISHGGPLRLIVPGYFGCNQIKYVQKLAATRRESSAKIQQKGYRFRPIGVPASPDQPSMWRMPVKSWLNGPGADGLPIQAGRVLFYGVAFSGERGIKAVDVSIDGGQTWTPASLADPNLGPNAWRIFSVGLALDAGEYTVLSRATDHQGDVQPRQRIENERGYGHNGWSDHGLEIVVSDNAAEARMHGNQDDGHSARSSQTDPLDSEAALKRGRTLFTEGTSPACGACHTLEDADTSGMVGPNLDTLNADEKRIRNALQNGVGAMPAYGNQLNEAQLRELTNYLLRSTRK